MPVRLVLIGLAAGVFGALFGVGGGIVMVPLLILLAAYPERSAMATSLAAIGLIAAEGAIFFALHGDIEPAMRRSSASPPPWACSRGRASSSGSRPGG